MEVIQKLNTQFRKDQKVSPIRIKGLLKKREETLENFLIKFFVTWNQEKETIFVKTKEVQTTTGKRRSIGDIFLLSLYYYPKTTLREVIDIIYDVLFQEVPNFRSSYCHTIHKRVFYKGGPNQHSHLFDGELPDEHKLTVAEWKQKT